jgi:hypothetical protein
MVDRLEPLAKNEEEIYLVARLRSNVLAAALDTAGACKALDKVIGMVGQDQKERIESRRGVGQLECP